MKLVWEESDIVGGTWVGKEAVDKAAPGHEQLRYIISTIHLLGYRDTPDGQKVTLTALTDGMVSEQDNKLAAAEALTAGDYRPMDLERVASLIAHKARAGR